MIWSALKSKTILFALVLAVFGVVEMNAGLLRPYMSEQMFGFFSIGVGLIVAILRVLTTVPLKDK